MGECAVQTFGLPFSRAIPAATGWFWVWHERGEGRRARSSGQSQQRLVLPSGLRWRFGNWKQSPVRCAGPLAAGMRPNSAQFSKFGNHEAVPFVFAASRKSNLKKKKQTKQKNKKPPGSFLGAHPHAALQPPALSPAPKFTLLLLKIRKTPPPLGRAATQKLLEAALLRANRISVS